MTDPQLRPSFVLMFVLIFVLALGVTPVSAQEEFRPHVEIGTSVAYGKAYELVLRNKSYHNPISRLIWPVPTSATLGLTATLPWASWTSTSVSLEGLTPIDPGTLVDEDWDAGDLAYGKSTHEAYLTAHWTARAEHSLHLGPLTVSGGGIYRWTTWEGWNGTGRYVSTYGDVEELTFTGLMIAYRQQWFIPYFGANLALRLPFVTITPAFRFSPYTYCNDMDNHKYARDDVSTYDDRDFLDQLEGGYYVQGSLEAAIGDRTQWGLRLQGELATGAQGDTVTTYSYQSSSGETAFFPTDKNAAGGWFRQVSLTVFVRN